MTKHLRLRNPWDEDHPSREQARDGGCVHVLAGNRSVAMAEAQTGAYAMSANSLLLKPGGRFGRRGHQRKLAATLYPRADVEWMFGSKDPHGC